MSHSLACPVQYKKITLQAVKEQFAAIGTSATIQKEQEALYQAHSNPHALYAIPTTLGAKHILSKQLQLYNARYFRVLDTSI